MFNNALLMAAGASIATGGAGYVVDYSCRRTWSCFWITKRKTR